MSKKANISREAKKAEAIERMRKLGIYEDTIKQFEDEDLISVAEPPLGAHYWADPETMQQIRDFEAEYNALVYYVVRSYANIGRNDCYLYVSDCEDEWGMDYEDLADPESGVMVYCYNHDDPILSEFGSVGLKKTVAAGLQRIW